MKASWLELWARLGTRGDPDPVYQNLVLRYSEAGRAYHNLRHIEHCLSELASLPEPRANRDAIEFALWFHDAIYDTKAKDNEEQSAELARNIALHGGLPQSFADVVADLILSTKHTGPAPTPAAQLIVDVDLAILGTPKSGFDEYERQIREEYRWVPDEDFRKGRSAILERFLHLDRIYSTPEFCNRYEAQARENLARSIQQLR